MKMKERRDYKRVPGSISLPELARRLGDERNEIVKLNVSAEMKDRQIGAINLINKILNLPYFKGHPAYDGMDVIELIMFSLKPDGEKAKAEFKSAEQKHNQLHARLRELWEQLDSQEEIKSGIENNGTADTDDYNKYQDVCEVIEEDKSELEELQKEIFADSVEYESAKERVNVLRALQGYLMNVDYFRTLKDGGE